MLSIRQVIRKQEYLQFLIKRGYDIDKDINQRSRYTHSTLLHDVIDDRMDEYDRLHILRALRKASIDLNQPDPSPDELREGRTPLIAAIVKERDMVAFLLIEKKADLKKCQDTPYERIKGWSPLIAATTRVNLRVMNALLDAGADINQENLLATDNNRYQTALMYALTSKNDYVRENASAFLIRRGAALKNSQGTRTDSICSRKERIEIKKEIEKVKSKILEVGNQLIIYFPGSITNLICSYMEGFSFFKKRTCFMNGLPVKNALNLHSFENHAAHSVNLEMLVSTKQTKKDIDRKERNEKGHDPVSVAATQIVIKESYPLAAQSFLNKRNPSPSDAPALISTSMTGNNHLTSPLSESESVRQLTLPAPSTLVDI